MTPLSELRPLAVIGPVGLALLAVHCVASGKNTVHIESPELVPYDIGPIETALWLNMSEGQEAQGEGIAILVMSDASISCAELEAWWSGVFGFGYAYEDEEPPGLDGNGVFAYFLWSQYDEEGDGDDAGYEGLYGGALYEGGAASDEGDLSRRVLVTLYSEGVLWIPGGYGGTNGEVTTYTDNTVSGRLTGSFLDANFEADHCGSLEPDGYDTGFDR